MLVGVTWEMVSAEKLLVPVKCEGSRRYATWCDMGDGVSREVACYGDM